MSERRLTIGRRLLQRVLEHCMEEKPLEACGILAGLGDTVSAAYATDNSRHSPITFEIEPSQQEAAMERMAERGEELVGIYHSHPTAPAVPSVNDIQQAVHYPDAIRLIISLNGPAEMKAFLIKSGEVQEVPLDIVDTAGGEYHDLRTRGVG